MGKELDAVCLARLARHLYHPQAASGTGVAARGMEVDEGNARGVENREKELKRMASGELQTPRERAREMERERERERDWRESEALEARRPCRIDNSLHALKTYTVS